MTRDVVVIVGSIREGSLNRKLAHALEELAPATMTLEEVAIAHLPLFNPDMDNAPPLAWVDFRTRIAKADAILFVSPEHNRSVPAALKNALDIASRPYGHNVWSGKPALVVTASPGAIGGFGANHHLRQSLVFLNVPVMQQPEAYVSGVAALFDDAGELTNEATQGFLTSFMAAFAAWAERNKVEG